MSISCSIEAAITLAEHLWPGLEFKRKSALEASSSCPFCQQATDDGFLVFADSARYWCRKCNQSGWLDRDNGHKLTETELVEMRLRRLEREQRDIKRRLSAIERLNLGHDHIDYHRLLDADDRQWWHEQGINDDSIDKYQLGICYSCPTDLQRRPSHTIPIYDSHHEQLLNIRHRLVGAVNGGGRYRPHMAGLPGKVLFNAELVHTERDLYMAEGCKKGIVLSSHDIPTLGVLGKYGFNLDWLQHFSKVRNLTLCPDPDAGNCWGKLGQQIAKASSMNVRVCSLPMKPDDLFIAGGTVTDFEHYLKLGRKAH